MRPDGDGEEKNRMTISYDELAAALFVSPASIGTLLRRARTAFQKEYLKRYGEQ